MNAPSMDCPTRSQLYQWFQMITAGPITLTQDTIRKTIYVLKTHPDIAFSSPKALDALLAGLGKGFKTLINCDAALKDLQEVLSRVLELKPHPDCAPLLKRHYIDQMEMITHHRLQNVKKRIQHEHQKKQNSHWFVMNRLEEQRKEKKLLALQAFEASETAKTDLEIEEEDTIEKKVKTAMMENPFQALDFTDCIDIEVPPMQEMCQNQVVSVPEPLPVVSLSIQQFLTHPMPLSDPRIPQMIQRVGVQTLLTQSDRREELPRLPLLLDLSNTLAEILSPEQIRGMSFPLPKDARLLKTPLTDYFLIPRPGLFPFLDRVSQCCRLFLYVSGLQDDLTPRNVGKVLDPEGRIFQDRIYADLNALKVSVEDMEQAVIFSSRATLWESDTQTLQSTQFSPSKTVRETTFRLSALSEMLLGPGIPLPWASEDPGELSDVAEGLETAYSRFLQNGGKQTFAYELLQTRGNVLQGEKVSFSVYERSLGELEYTVDRLHLYRFTAKHMGAIEGEGGIEVAEYPNAEKRLVSGSWLLQCFFHLKKLPFA